MILLLIFILYNSGCIFYNDRDYGWDMFYSAGYNQILNSSAIIQEFKKNNISYIFDEEYDGKQGIKFYFGKGINNDSIESSCGNIEIWLIEDFPDLFPEGHTNLNVRLNRTRYPPVKDKKELSSRKPLLEKSMEYILEIIYNATDQWPDSKNIYIGDTD